MNRLLSVLLSLAVLPPSVFSQSPVKVILQPSPVLVQTGTDAVFTVLTVPMLTPPEVLSITWYYPGGSTPLGLWVAGAASLNPVPQYLGRVSISATQLRITSATLRDAGNYTVEVNPLATTGLSSASTSTQLRVYDGVAGVSLSVPPRALENSVVSLNCTWMAGTGASVQWGKGGSALSPDPRVTISQGLLVLSPAQRADAGVYSCLVSNPVSASTATNTLVVYYGPDTPQMSRSSPAQCVGGVDGVVGQTVQLSCVCSSLPPALFSWFLHGQPVASSQPGSSVQTFTANQSGQYSCVARNAITGNSSEQGTSLVLADTCLSGGAVAGIVIGCVVALVLIIIAIILLLRCRNVDQRLREVLKSHPARPLVR